MLVEDIHDLIMMFILLVVFVILGSGLRISDEKDFVYESLELRDEEDVFFLNLLKTNVEDKIISDLIILNENEDKNLKEEIEKILKFYGKDYYEYGLTIKYPDKEPILLGCDYGIDKGIKQNLPSLKNGLIELQFVFQDMACLGDIKYIESGIDV